MIKGKLDSIIDSKSIFKIKSFLENHWVQVSIVLGWILLLRFYPLLQGKTFYFGDNYSLMVPGKLFTAHWLKQGILPLWNSTIFAGLPWIGDVNQSILYPSTFLFTWMGPAAALNLNLILHVSLTFFGMYLVSKKILTQHKISLVAAVFWAISMQVSVVLNSNMTSLQSLAWLPIIVYLGLFINDSFKHKFFFAFGVLLQFAAGYPLYLIFSILLAVFCSFLEKEKSQSILNWFWQWALTALLTVSLSAVIWLPFVELLTASTRLSQSSEQALVGSLHHLELIKFLLPYFFENPRLGIRWGPGWINMPNVFIYFGWIGALAMASFILKVKKQKKELSWFIAWLLIIIYSFGRYLPFDISAIIGPTRVPSTALIMASFIGSLIISQNLFKFNIKKRFIYFSLGFVLVSLLIYFLIKSNFDNFWYFINQILKDRLLQSSFHTLEKNYLIFENIFHNLIINSSLFVLSIWLVKKKFYLIFIAILIVDLIFNTQGLMLCAPKKIYSDLENQFIFQEQLEIDDQARSLIRNHNTPFTDFGAYLEATVIRQPFSDSYIDKQELTEFNHLKRMSQGMTPDWNMVAGVNILNGYTTLMPQKMDQLWNENAESSPAINSLPEIKINNPLLSQWSVKYYLVDNWFDVQEDLTHLQTTAEESYWTLYQLPALNRFRFAGETLENQDDPDFQLELEKYSETPNKIEFNFDNSANHRHIIIADRYDPNWIAVVNGQSVEVQEFNHMRRVPIEPGLNQVKLTYRPKYFYYGIAISLLALMAGIGGIVVEHRSKISKI